MSLDKAIKSGKEWRKPYRRGASVSQRCASHKIGYECSWCASNRTYTNRKRELNAAQQEPSK